MDSLEVVIEYRHDNDQSRGFLGLSSSLALQNWRDIGRRWQYSYIIELSNLKPYSILIWRGCTENSLLSCNLSRMLYCLWLYGIFNWYCYGIAIVVEAARLP